MNKIQGDVYPPFSVVSMELQRFPPLLGRWFNLAKGAFFALALLGAGLSAPAAAVENGGLGPLSIRNQFPATLGFLTYTPDSPVSLPDAEVRIRYQYAITNTFINTQAVTANTTPVIDAAIVSGGLTILNFPAMGYGVYLDLEAQRHLVRVDYGLADFLEIGLEMAWVSFGGGFLDNRIESVENLFGGLNEDRTFSDRDRFDFYIARDGAFLRSSSEPFTTEAQDPVLNLKWTLGEGGDVLPAFSIKLSYKVPLDPNPSGSRALISSGGTDFGYYFLFGKAVGNVVAHLQVGTTELEVAPNTFSEKLKHRMFGLEFRVNGENSIVVQSVTQTSIFLEGDTPTNTDFAISRQADVAILGYKHQSDGFLFELGTIEDYNQQRNESDITFYFEMGWQW